MLLSLLLLVGCSLAPSDRVLEQLGKDPANICLQWEGPSTKGRHMLFSRTNCVNCTVTCTQDGISVEQRAPDPAE